MLCQKVEENNKKSFGKAEGFFFWKGMKNMSLYDKIYLDMCDEILKKGYYDTNRTGISTYKLPHQIMKFDLAEEFPILTTKFVAFKTAVKELLWNGKWKMEQ